MIAYIEGTIIHKGESFVVISTGHIGYKVFLLKRLQEMCSEGQIMSCWIHHAQTDSSTNLYGFETNHELFFFELLLTVSGIGPKTALTILNAAPAELIQQAVIENNTEHITKVAGIGRKNAEKIVLELRDKIKNISGHTATLSSTDGDVIDALLTLGYSQHEARTIVQKLPPDIEGTEERIRAALKSSGK